LAWVKLFSVALVVALAAPVRAEVVDGVAAAIDHQPVALSLLRAYHGVFEPDIKLEDALQRLIDDRLLANQARRYGQSLTPLELSRERVKHPKPPGPSDEEWLQLVTDRALAARFLEFRFGEFVPVTREQLQAYYNAHRKDFPGTLAEEEERVRMVLAPLARARREERFKRELRERADVRIDASLLL
jgi:hypothetical protein